jgi:tetratricopeptide (TPR) repeat protein
MLPLRPCPRLVLAVTLSVFGFFSPEAQAQDDFQRYLLAAERLYESGENERALVQLERARGLARGLAQDVAVALREGIFLADMGQWPKAQAAFREGLLLDPDAMLPFRVAPKLERDFEGVRTQVRKELRLSERPAPAPVKPPPAPPAPVVQKDRPQQPNLKAPEVQAPPAYAPSAEAVAPSRIPVVPIVLAGAGVVAASVGAVMGLQSRSSVSQVRSSFAGDALPAASELPGLSQQLEDARSQARLANVMFGTAAAAAVGGVISYLLWPGGGERDAKEAR